MESRNPNAAQLTSHNTLLASTSAGFLIRIGACLILAALMAGIFYSGSSASSSATALDRRLAAAPGNQSARENSRFASSAAGMSTIFRAPSERAFLPEPQSPETIATYAIDCMTPQTVFTVGQTVCVKVSGVPLSPFFPRRLTWATTDSTIVRTTNITADPQTDSLLITATSLVGSSVIDNRGLWQVVVRNPFFFFPEAIATFTVTDPANATADLGVASTFASNSVQTGSQAVYAFQVNNYGPDNSVDVRLTDAVPSGTSLVSFLQLSGPTFSCGTSSGLTTCSLASMAAGDVATFIATYQVNSGTEIINTANIASLTTSDLNSLNDSISNRTEVTASTGPLCTITCPPNIVAPNDPGTAGRVIPNNSTAFPQPTTSGTCGSVSLAGASPNQLTNNYFFPIGTSFITASTESGEECTFTVTVNDVENPTISCPADITTFESPQGSGSRAVNYTVTATDNSGTLDNPAGSATVDCGAHPSGSSFPVGTTQVTCTATDAANNSSTSCSFNVTVNPVTGDCTLTPPAPIVVNSDANACGTIVTFDVTPSATGCGTITCNRPSGSFFPGGETLVTCTSSPDGASTSFTVTVNDTTLPVPNLLDPLPTITRDCAATAGIPTSTVIQTPTGPVTIIVMEPPTATDNCGGTIAGSTEDPRTYQDPGTFIVHWTYTDASGNTSTQNQTIVVTGDDTSPPTITAPGPVTFNTGPTATSCGVTIANLDLALGQAIANDTCSVATVERIGVPAGNVFPVGPTTLTYTATDETGHQASATQLVTVVDNTLPVLTAAPGPVTLYTGAGATSCGVTVTNLDATLGTAVASDNCAFTVTRVGVPAANFFPVGMTTITYGVTDASGNIATTTTTQNVTVIDNTPPTITAPANATYQCASEVPAASPSQATASDNCVSPTVTVSETNNGGVGSTASPLVITRTFTATDAANNSANAVQTITVIDNTPPTISCPANIAVYLPLNTTATSMAVNYPAATATDNCAGSITFGYSIASGSVFSVGPTTVTATATDAFGNSSSCTFTVTVLYNFTGFLSPVSNPPIVNNVNAGRSIPLKFSLSGNKGLDIFPVGSPASQQIACDSSAPLSDLEGTETPGGSTLTYSPDQYHYNWKTEKSWAGTCRQLVVTLNDGSVHIALFKFK